MHRKRLSLFIAFHNHDATVQILIPSPHAHRHMVHSVLQSLERGQIIRCIRFPVPMALANLEGTPSSVEQDLSQMYVFFDFTLVTKKTEQGLTVKFTV